MAKKKNNNNKLVERSEERENKFPLDNPTGTLSQNKYCYATVVI